MSGRGPHEDPGGDAGNRGVAAKPPLGLFLSEALLVHLEVIARLLELRDVAGPRSPFQLVAERRRRRAFADRGGPGRSLRQELGLGRRLHLDPALLQLGGLGQAARAQRLLLPEILVALLLLGVGLQLVGPVLLDDEAALGTRQLHNQHGHPPTSGSARRCGPTWARGRSRRGASRSPAARFSGRTVPIRSG